MKKLILLLTAIPFFIFAQAEYVETDNIVYGFLERMETEHIITDYNSFVIPKSRKEISNYIKQVILHENELSGVDKDILKDLMVEFEFDLFGTLKNSAAVFNNSEDYFSTDKQRYLYFNAVEGKGNLFINILGEGNILVNSFPKSNSGYKGAAGIFGGAVRGTILNHVGFKLEATNGMIAGDKQAGYLLNSLKNNFMFNEKKDEKFFDEAFGYITIDFDLINLKFGRDRLLLGYGNIKPLISDAVPLFDYLALNINYDILNFSFFHGKLLGEYSSINDMVTGEEAVVKEKYIAYHRIGLNINKHLDFGAGEIVIYGNRPLDFSYLNPFNFYKAAEHSNRDRDNSMLFFDFNNNSFKSIKITGLLLIDDISFSKLGTGWWGNQTMLNAGIFLTQPVKNLPLDIRLEYFKIDPYVFSHRLYKNNFTHFGNGLNEPLEPNSSVFSFQTEYRFSNSLSLNAGITYTVHGANPINADGTIENVGGSVLLGHRTFDSEETEFLAGDKEYLRKYEASLIYEPINEIYIKAYVEYIKNSLQNSLIDEQLNSILALMVKL